MPFQKFINRYQAARLLLAEPEISRYRNASDTLILAIPRGALQMGEVFHDKLGLPLDIIGTKKIPHPFNEELAIGAVGPYGIFFVDTVSFPDIPSEYVEKERRRLENAIAKRYASYRGSDKFPVLRNKTIILVDDGLATGSTMLAAIQVVRTQNPARIVVAVPVSPQDTLEKIRKALKTVDSVVCLFVPPVFHAIGEFYDDFPQVEDEEAIEILKRCRSENVL